MSDHTQFLIHALSDPSVYPQPPKNVDVIQTHISVVFIAGDYVYKIKKPLNMGFLDYTTLEKRRFFCEQEVSLNSRFSKGIYLEVVDIHSSGSNVNFTGDGKLTEVAVKMRKISEDRVLKRMLLSEKINNDHMEKLAQRLRKFHAGANHSKRISLFGAPEVIHRNLIENFDQVKNYIDISISEQRLHDISSGSFEFLGKYLPDFKERVVNGFIRDLHGDLHSEHVVFLDEIMLVDCIEFNDRFRYSDTISDLAFLLMDVDYLGFPALSKELHRHYSEDSPDDDFTRGLYNFYKSYRAFVRGKVNCFALNDPEISQSSKDGARQSAEDYFRLSEWYIKNRPTPQLIIMCGLMGSGKSYLAQKIGSRTGAIVLRSDVLRKEILGIDASEKHLDAYGHGIYSQDMTGKTYSRLFERASDYLKNGTSVVLDASFSRFEYRDSARDIAIQTGADFLLLQVVASDEIIRERLLQRAKFSKDPSDGRWELFHEQKGRFDEIRPSEIASLEIYDSSQDSQAELGALIRETFFR
ncbi:MAG: AAA family ATPase [Desulfomonilaceae bacterium]